MVILNSEPHVIEEIQLFETAQPVDSLTISHSKVRKRGGKMRLGWFPGICSPDLHTEINSLVMGWATCRSAWKMSSVALEVLCQA